MGYHEGTRFVCASSGCSATICLTQEEEEKLRRTHEFFYCPNGHSQHFTGKTKEEKQIEELRRMLEQKQHMLDWRGEHIMELKAELRSLRSRLGAKTRKLRAVA